MKTESGLIRSASEKVPELRYDLQIIPVEDDGRRFLCFHDPMGYVPADFALNASVRPLLGMFSGALTVEQIAGQLNGRLETDNILEFVRLLDRHRLLNSRYFRRHARETEEEFEGRDERPPALAGQSYPSHPDELNAFLDKLFSGVPSSPRTSIRALFAPHIDVAVGSRQYVQAFSALKGIRPRTVVILATSHYSGYYGRYYEETPFIGSQKTFRIPGRSFPADRSALRALKESGPETGFTLHDRAHRTEHSIELHLLFASAVWKHDFRIIPVLVSGFDELFYHRTGDLAQKIDRFTSRLKSVTGDDTFFLISGDLSHVGKKFGDHGPAAGMRSRVEAFDHNFLNCSAEGNPDQLLELISAGYDNTRVCGFPPLYTFLTMFPGIAGDRLHYHWWDERERESAVSFGSVLYGAMNS